MIRIGYAGVNTELPTASRTFRIRNYSDELMLSVARDNLIALENILRWNLKREIYLFRITSHLVPYGSSPINSGLWKSVLAPKFQQIGVFIIKNQMRVSMHPGQYTVLNSPNEQSYQNALHDLEYHTAILDLMGLPPTHKIVLHGGGGYGNKSKSLEVTIARINKLAPATKSRLVLENDDSVFSAEDIYAVCNIVGIPGVFDQFHHQIVPSFTGLTDRSIIKLLQPTWGHERQKIHYSNQEPGMRRGSHSQTINLESFGQFYKTVKDMELDIMLEVKDKQASVERIHRQYPEIS